MEDPYVRVRKKLRIVAELRYPAVPSLFDYRGKIIEDIFAVVSDQLPFWRSGPGSITFSDHPNEPVNEFLISIKKTSVLLEDCSLEEFISRTQKYFGLMFTQMAGSIRKISRCGVRMIEICTPGAGIGFGAAADMVTNKFFKLPPEIDIEPKDVAVHIVHDRGQYKLGPVRRGEPWATQNFSDPASNVPEAGVGLDIDSYVLDVPVSKIDDANDAFLAAYELTKSIEENLLHYLGLFDA